MARGRHVDTIINGDSRNLEELRDDSIKLAVTSPPYNVTKQYDEDLTLEEYLSLLEDVIRETRRVLQPGGIFALNIANVGRKPYLPLNCHVIQLFMKLGYDVIDEIIWDKAASAGGSCAWGSWQSASNPSLRDVHEYIIVARKPGAGKGTRIPGTNVPPAGMPTEIEGRKWSVDLWDLATNAWAMNAESARRVNHPAPFPVELVYRLALVYTAPGDVVFDPFMGSGTTAIAALISGRRFIGYELNPEYAGLARDRINRTREALAKRRLTDFM